MRKRIATFLLIALLPIVASAQAAGGQVKRPVKKQQTKPITPVKDTSKNKEIAIQIDKILKDLVTLGKIEEKNQKMAEFMKRDFVENVIMPEVVRLGEKVDDVEKRVDIKNIIRMLKDKRTLSSDNQGRTDMAGKRQIIEIMEKVRRLKHKFN